MAQELLKKLEAKLETLHGELESYTKTYNKVMDERKKKLMEEHKESFLKNPEAVDLNAIARDIFYVSGFHQRDIRSMQVRLLNAYDLYKDLAGDKEFSNEFNTTIAYLKQILPKQMFVVEGDKFVEITEGSIEKMKGIYEEKKLFNLFESQIKGIFNE